MDATLSAGKLDITYNSGAHAVYNLTTDVDVQIYPPGSKQAPTTLVSGQPLELVQTYTTYGDYRVRLTFNNREYLDLVMGDYANKVTWANDLAGANACVAEVKANLA